MRESARCVGGRGNQRSQFALNVSFSVPVNHQDRDGLPAVAGKDQNFLQTNAVRLRDVNVLDIQRHDFATSERQIVKQAQGAVVTDCFRRVPAVQFLQQSAEPLRPWPPRVPKRCGLQGAKGPDP